MGQYEKLKKLLRLLSLSSRHLSHVAILGLPQECLTCWTTFVLGKRLKDEPEQTGPQQDGQMKPQNYEFHRSSRTGPPFCDRSNEPKPPLPRQHEKCKNMAKVQSLQHELSNVFKVFTMFLCARGCTWFVVCHCLPTNGFHIDAYIKLHFTCCRLYHIEAMYYQ